MDQRPNTSSASERPLRIWPAAMLAAVYWIFQLVLSQVDLPMFSRFLSNVVGNGVFLLAFLILWLTNGTVRGLTRLLGLALLFGGAVLGIAFRDRSFDRFGYVMTAVPYVLTAWAAWMIAARLRPKFSCRISMAAAVLLGFGAVDLLRWEGLDARLRSTFALRWSRTAEQEFLASNGAATPRAARAWTPGPGDVAEFRGTRRDGVVRGVRAAEWKEAPPQVWKRKVGPGWSSVIVVDGFLVTQEQRGESETIVCYDAETGAELWSHRVATRFFESLAGPGPRATPTFRDGKVFALGATGVLTCLDAPTGKALWSKNLAQEAGAPPPMWGFSASPLVSDGKVFVFIGGAKPRGLLALDAATGAPAWSCEGKESYGSAEILTLDGVPQIVMQDTGRLAGISVADGKVLWERPGDGDSVMPILQPQVLPDGGLLAAAAQGLVALDVKRETGKWMVADRWASKKLRPTFNDFVVREGCVYGLDEGILCCVDLKNGERVWKKGRYGGGQILLLEDPGLLVVLSERGELALVPARREEPGDVPKFPAIEGKTWNHPVVARDRLYVRNGVEMACFRLSAP